MRHESRTHRVALDWLFDRINVDPKIQNNVDTKNPLADMLTKRSCTRDEWNHLLRLLNIMNVSMFSCSRSSNFSFRLDQEAVRYVKKNSGKQPERGIDSGKAEAYEFELLEHEESSFAKCERSEQPRESKFGPAWCLRPQLETVCEGHQRWPDSILVRGNEAMLKPQTRGKRGEQKNLRLSPQLETVCEGREVNPFRKRKLECQNMQISNPWFLEKVF